MLFFKEIFHLLVEQTIIYYQQHFDWIRFLLQQLLTVHIKDKGKGKQSLHMTRQSLRFPEFSVSQISRLSTNECINFTSSKHHLPLHPKDNIPGIHFCYRLSRTNSHIAAGRIIAMKISSDIIGNPNRILPTCGVVPQLSALLRD